MSTDTDRSRSTASPQSTLRIDAADLVATAGADVTLGALHAALESQRVWLVLDGPFTDGTSLGAALENGAPGPLAALFGAPRDQVLGATFAAANGTVVRTGGRVVKNVAGFDLAKLVVGGRGAFGRLLEVNLRLRAAPPADRTRAFSGSRDQVAGATARLMTDGTMPAAFEVVSPALARELGLGGDWGLMLRAMGTVPGVDEELAAAATTAAALACREVPAPADAWPRWLEMVRGWPVVARIGADPAAWSEAVQLAEQQGARDFTVTVPRGTVRAALPSGAAPAIVALREAAARRGWPVTLERADAATLEQAGAWGAMNAGTARLVERLRATFGAAADGRSGGPAADHDRDGG